MYIALKVWQWFPDVLPLNVLSSWNKGIALTFVELDCEYHYFWCFKVDSMTQFELYCQSQLYMILCFTCMYNAIKFALVEFMVSNISVVFWNNRYTVQFLAQPVILNNRGTYTLFFLSKTFLLPRCF